MDEDLSAVDSALLERWAYGRATTEAERIRADRALRELHGRAPAVQVNTAAVDTATTQPALPDRPSPEKHAFAPQSADMSGPWWRRIPVIVAASTSLLMLLTILAVALGPLLSPDDAASPSSLDVFARQSTAEEGAIYSLMQRQGERVSVGPRILGSVAFGTIVAYRSTVTDRGENGRDLVCVGVVEQDGTTRESAFTDSRCTELSDFEIDGLSSTLFGIGGQYDVEWGPVGDAELSALVSEAQRLQMDPGYQRAFFDLPSTAADAALVGSSILADGGEYVATRVATAFSIADLLRDAPAVDRPDERIIVYSAVELGAGSELVCIAAIDGDALGEYACTDTSMMASAGLSVSVPRQGFLIIVTWAGNGDVTAVVAEP